MPDADRIQPLQRSPQLVEIPVLGVPVLGGAVDVSGDHIRHHVLICSPDPRLEHPESLA